MVFPYASTPVTEAARHNDFSMVRWLVEQGADITIPDKYGDRPYTVAVQNKNQEMAAYLKALEPEEWHNEQEKARQLMPYKLPAKLVEYLKTGPLRLEFPERELVKWAELYPYMDVTPEIKNYGIWTLSMRSFIRYPNGRHLSLIPENISME